MELNIDVEIASDLYSKLQAHIAQKRIELRCLNSEIQQLQENRSSLRKQIALCAGESGRGKTGENETRIMEYLNLIPDNKGATLTELKKAIGIGYSSIAYALRNGQFKREGKLWKRLINPQKTTC